MKATCKACAGSGRVKRGPHLLVCGCQVKPAREGTTGRIPFVDEPAEPPEPRPRKMDASERAQQSKSCQECGHAFYRGTHRLIHSEWKWRARRYCGLSCASLAANRKRWAVYRAARGQAVAS